MIDNESYVGYVKFFEGDIAIWFRVDVESTRIYPEQTIKLFTYARKSMSFNISMTNSLDDDIVYQVSKKGTGISGKDKFIVPALSKATYQLLFYPIYPFEGIGEIKFMN